MTASFHIPTLLKKVASGQKTKADLTREEARWIMARALAGAMADVQTGALLAALRLKGESVAELAGFLEASYEAALPLRSPVQGMVATCGATGGKSRAFLATPAAALVAAAAGVPVCVAGRSAHEAKHPTTEVEVCALLGLEVNGDEDEVAGALRDSGFAAVRQTRLHPALASLSALRFPLGMRTVVQALEKIYFPSGAETVVAGAFHLGYLERIAQACAELAGQPGWPRRFLLVQEREGGIDLLPGDRLTGFIVTPGRVREWKVALQEIGIERYSAEELPGLDAPATAAVAQDILAGGGTAAQREMVTLNAALLIHAGRPSCSLSDSVLLARQVLAGYAALGKLDELRRRRCLFLGGREETDGRQGFAAGDR